MIVGNPDARTDNDKDKGVQGLSFRCFNNNGFGGAPGTGGDTKYFPKGPCAGGIRANIYFPTCWDGKNLDSPNHRSHVAYPADGNRNHGAACPATHPVRIPQLFLETMWDTRQFNNKAEWPADGSQPFVYSTGDPTGYGQHADYVFGWKGDALQRAMDSKCYVNCPMLKSQSIPAANKCNLKPRYKEEIDACKYTVNFVSMGRSDNDYQGLKNFRERMSLLLTKVGLLYHSNFRAYIKYLLPLDINVFHSVECCSGGKWHTLFPGEVLRS
jgi:Domain of unknown function (DUF1996)